MTIQGLLYSLSQKWVTTAMLISFCLACIPSVTANTNDTIQDGIQQQTKAFLVKYIDGQEQLIALDKLDKNDVKADSVFEYQTTLTNKGNDKISSMTVTLSVPNSVILIGYTKPEQVMASVGDGQFYDVPLMTTIDGKDYPLPLANYRALRWQVANIAQEQSKVLSYRVILKESLDNKEKDNEVEQ